MLGLLTGLLGLVGTVGGAAGDIVGEVGETVGGVAQKGLGAVSNVVNPALGMVENIAGGASKAVQAAAPGISGAARAYADIGLARATMKHPKQFVRAAQYRAWMDAHNRVGQRNQGGAGINIPWGNVLTIGALALGVGVVVRMATGK